MSKLLDLASPSLNATTDEEKLIAALVDHREWHLLYPPFLARTSDLPDLDWKSVPFTLESRSDLPKAKGVYAFAVTISVKNLPPSTHIMYIGKGGDINSNNTIYKRYYDYIRTERINDRPRICAMLRKWKGLITYYYATVDDNVATADIEQTLLDIFMPPLNRGDYSAELTSLLKGANII